MLIVRTVIVATVHSETNTRATVVRTGSSGATISFFDADHFFVLDTAYFFVDRHSSRVTTV